MTDNLQGRNVLIITANAGIERDELLEPMRVLKAQGATITHASVKKGSVQT
jgi:protease I